VRDFLIRFCAAEIPWLRMYKLFPAWQALCKSHPSMHSL
jgi:hypothetical protein